MRTTTENALLLWKVQRKKKKSRSLTPLKIYSRTAMPIVDIHMHIYPHHDPDNDVVAATQRYVNTMDKCGIQLSVNLSGLPESIEQSKTLHKVSQGRVLICPGTFFRAETKCLWWTKRQLKEFTSDPNIAGLKIWCKYQRPLLKKSVDSKLKKQAELGMPAIGMHIADPPAYGYWQPEFWQCISDAEKVIRKYPQINFIMAHGFWLMTSDEGLDVLATFFDTYPHLHVDLSAVFHWWDSPSITYSKLRNFIIKYKERILYGTDGNPQYTSPERIAFTRIILETKQKHLTPFFGDPGRLWNIHGLGLPIEVLNYIYYWNAARLVPNVRRGLLSLGYAV